MTVNPHEAPVVGGRQLEEICRSVGEERYPSSVCSAPEPPARQPQAYFHLMETYFPLS